MNKCRGCDKALSTDVTSKSADKVYDPKRGLCFWCYNGTRRGVWRRRDNLEVFEVVGVAESRELGEPSELYVVYYHYVGGKMYMRPIREWLTLATADGQHRIYEQVMSTRENES